MVSVRERIRLDGKPIPEPLFLKYFWHVVETLNKLPTVRGALCCAPVCCLCLAHVLTQLVWNPVP